ncbi:MULTISPECIES: hypothetical protein [Aliiglaciecola]|uniref:hypothetical protein n=1 Tax=Aliiglaciecola TaxID=1406885 RepID=UPI001C08F650|nr:hypothetical protein [Aliiglaciecola lipolytica]MBU2877501.1 hypothetical protein [Aliiglaciecola lipolytica]
MLKNWLYKMGSNPHKSWADFKIGLTVFIAGVICIFGGLKLWIWLQIPGVLLLALGLIFAAKGYLGIFANRFSQTLSQFEKASDKAKRNTQKD